MNNYFNCNICEVANPTGSYPPTIFPHLTDKNSFVRIEDDVDDLLYTEHVVFIKANRKNIYDLPKVQFLFFDFTRFINNTIHEIPLDYSLQPSNKDGVEETKGVMETTMINKKLKFMIVTVMTT